MPTKKKSAPAAGAAKAAKKAAPASKAGATKKADSPKKAAQTAAPAAKGAAKKATPAKKAPAAKVTPPKKAAAKAVAPAKAPAKKATPSKKAAAKTDAPAKAEPKAAAPAMPPPAVPRVGSVLGSLPRPSKNPPARLTKSPYDAKFLDAQRALLLKEREVYERQAEALLAEAQSLTANREPGDVQFDEESGEGDTLAVERDQDLELSARARSTVEDIDEALERIDKGVYGICAGSGQPIPKERLKAIPWATERVEYKVGGFGRL